MAQKKRKRRDARFSVFRVFSPALIIQTIGLTLTAFRLWLEMHCKC